MAGKNHHQINTAFDAWSTIFLDGPLSRVGCISSDLDEKLRIWHLSNYIALIRTFVIKFDILISVV
jgi:hypothetical protein